MGKAPKSIYLFLLFVSLCQCLPSILQAAFYKYVDEDGRVYYVDDLNKVPEAYLDQRKADREKYDHLSGQDRVNALEREREQQRQIELENERRMQEHMQAVQEAEEEEKRRQAEEARRRMMEHMQTRVTVDGNRILVPVTIANGGAEITVNLLLDTGASQVVLHRSAAESLNMTSLKRGLAQVAGGQNIYVESGKVSYLKVGPFSMPDATVLIINHEGPPVSYSGLLGMNFLRNVQYTIDYQNQVIHWQPPGGTSPQN